MRDKVDDWLHRVLSSVEDDSLLCYGTRCHLHQTKSRPDNQVNERQLRLRGPDDAFCR